MKLLDQMFKAGMAIDLSCTLTWFTLTSVLDTWKVLKILEDADEVSLFWYILMNQWFQPSAQIVRGILVSVTLLELGVMYSGNQEFIGISFYQIDHFEFALAFCSRICVLIH